MDAKDVRIFCEMAFKNPSVNSIVDRRISPTEIGRKVGLDEKTVRVRIKRMEEEGFIKYYQALPSLPLVGIGSLGWFRFGTLNLATKRNLVEHLKRAPNVLDAFDYLGNSVSAGLAGPTASDVQKAADSTISNFELAVLGQGDRPVGRATLTPDRLDWQIIKELRYHAQAGLKDVAKALSITPRMAEYRISKLLEGEAILIRAIIDAKKQHGLVFFEVECSVAEGRQSQITAKLVELYGERLWSVQNLKGGVLLASLFAFSLDETEDEAWKCSKLEGVKSTSLFVLKEMVEPNEPNWIDGLIDMRISASAN